ncbi:UDP-N-acetylmuramate--L-alanine ligase [Candidatus Daviesbacteria bacterium RIFCSPHIGHO2_02_FULL_36_13]|uniref:UDP-N-acetylmuramate--L-alanine ligase n=1 Tax=Candidatus Daviesbacteria bacterium RIFCSPHIGHO2_02_FULL_36_13 TaxID=1797768 RepID=A0A1F5JQ20_9BACT|nr:MAG: UDP-N-acetylmuramate--L-alanine ligase [Candidatus Daviesbacteria bacterium RIFCSPHIGHO2_02_FULL_36_13]OGE44672.1 MAG: UDP-N-acetylmuramate--L-alanine ligase [Candidatus Daviesbacteria bacterium RIFCSPLOWO2_01_FULL_36_8]
MIKKVHFLGIGGSGASAAAAIAQHTGFEVTGCDLDISNEFTTPFSLDQLLKGHSASHLKGGNVNILAVTPAIYSLDPTNEELMEAKRLGIEVLTWQEFMGKYLMEGKFVIAVSGTHGKTTTTAMIAKMLEDAGLDPTVELGSIMPSWKANYRNGNSKYFVVEADEYNDNYLPITPDISVVTNIDMDHPEYFKDFEEYKESFKKFILKTKGAVVANLSDASTAEVMKTVLKSIPENDTRQFLDYSKQQFNLSLKIPGTFNILNATAAFQVGLLLGINPETIKSSLQSFTGAGRRFEYIGDYNRAKIYSDFGHHPTEIRETLKAVREKFPNERVLVIYQPHMFTRTKYLFEDFVKVFTVAPVDKIYIMDIYQSREKDLGEVSSKQLAETINLPSVLHIPSGTELQVLKPEIKNGDIVFFMSAGDTDKIAKQLVELR